ncbi:MAG: outer membrane beta-barrel protein [Bacteroidia bacterium]|nr:outer membrane beta-barrel protein [Bacteroidia bacterium]
MKKTITLLASCLLVASSLMAQDPAPESSAKVRFGLRAGLQPSWLGTEEKSNIPSGAKLGYGFGLNIEFRITESAAFLTGIGADFESARYKFKNEIGQNYEAMYWMNSGNEFVKANEANRNEPTNTAYVLKERTLKTTFVTIPIMLKLSTKEIAGIRYSGLFGGDIGFRAKATANDTYLEGRKYSAVVAGDYTVVPVEDQTGLNVKDEMSKLPARMSFNAGIGGEYKLSGNTAVFVNINYTMGLSNLMKKESEYTIYKTEPGANNSTPIKQNLKYRGIRITLGIMF